jgi:hypothetical protein
MRVIFGAVERSEKTCEVRKQSEEVIMNGKGIDQGFSTVALLTFWTG